MTWNFYYDREAENHFIADENGKTVAMVHQEDHGEFLASAPDMREEIDRLTVLLIRAQKLVPACHSRWHEDAHTQRLNSKEAA